MTVDPAKRRQDAVQREVSRLHTEARKLAKQMAEVGDLKPAADVLLSVAKQKADNAGLAKRTASKAEVVVGGPRTTDKWVEQKQAEDGDDDDDDG